MRRWMLILAGTLTCAAPAAFGLDKSDFEVKTTRDLVNLCSAASGEDMYEAAMGYCLGFVDAAHDYHMVVSGDDMLAPVACPDHEVTRKEVVDAFLSWAGANGNMLDKEAPLQGLMRAAAAKWPCSS